MASLLANGWPNSDVFSLNLLHPKGNLPSKFQVIGVRRFGGVREHPNRLTLTDRLVL